VQLSGVVELGSNKGGVLLNSNINVADGRSLILIFQLCCSVVWPEPETNMAEAPEQKLYLLVAGAWSSTSSGASCACLPERVPT
jgi:hypothetical protein